MSSRSGRRTSDESLDTHAKRALTGHARNAFADCMAFSDMVSHLHNVYTNTFRSGTSFFNLLIVLVAQLLGPPGILPSVAVSPFSFHNLQLRCDDAKRRFVIRLSRLLRLNIIALRLFTCQPLEQLSPCSRKMLDRRRCRNNHSLIGENSKLTTF